MNDKQLILYYYADGLSSQERRQIEAALAADPALQSRYDALRRELDGFGDAPLGAEVKAPEHLVARWHASIDRAAQLERQAERKPARVLHFASFGWGAAITAALALGIGIGVYLSGRNDPGLSVNPLPAIVEVAPSATTVGSADHWGARSRIGNWTGLAVSMVKSISNVKGYAVFSTMVTAVS